MQKYLMITLALLLGLSMLGCGGSRINGLPDNNAAPKVSNDIPGTVLYTTELIAGAGGWNSGGWPAHGTDVGEVVVSYSGTILYVTYVLADGYSFGPGGEDASLESLHLWVGSTPPVIAPGPPPVAPGQFPYKGAPDEDATEYTFTLPGLYTGGPLWIMAHGVICSPGGESYWIYSTETVTLWAGQNINSGYAAMTVIEEEGVKYLYVSIIPSDDWVIAEDHLWVGFDPDDPDYGIPYNKQGNPAIGHFPYQSPNPPYPRDEDFFKVPLADIPGYSADMWNDGSFHLCMALHVVVQQGYYDEYGNWVVTQGETAWGWDKDENHDFPGKRWGGWYCFDITRTWHEGGDGTCETAWGFDLDGTLVNDDGSMIGNGTSRDEPGWFPKFFGGPAENPNIKRWGWVITYFAD